MERISWGAQWLLPETYTAAWGARGIADQEYNKGKWTGKHRVSLLADREEGVGEYYKLKSLYEWLNKKVLPITLYYDGSSRAVTEIDDDIYHVRYTPNGSYGYVYIVAWSD